MELKNLDMDLQKSIQCDYCKRRLMFKIKKEDLDELKNNQLFNFVIVHSKDHALVVSVDGMGNIRRTRVAKLNEIYAEEKEEYREKTVDTRVLECEEIKSLADALKIFLEKAT